MSKESLNLVRVAAWWLCLWSLAASAQGVLFDLDADFDVDAVKTHDATVTMARRNGQAVIRLATGHQQDWPGITLKPSEGPLDLSEFKSVAVDVVNVGARAADVSLRVDTPTGSGQRVWVSGTASLRPGEKKTMAVELQPRLPSHLAGKLFGMRGYPGGYGNGQGIDPANIDQVLIFLDKPYRDHLLEINNIRAAGSRKKPRWLKLASDEFFPMIDRFGQFAHESWPGKTESIEEFPYRAQREAGQLVAHPGPDQWNQYGGWQAGPQLTATGHFRVEKYQGLWWLVDPEGRLFWSHGIDCVRSSTGSTPITDREFLFAGLPGKASPLAKFYGKGGWAPHGYYHGKSFETYNFTGANLQIKYGDNWQAKFADLCHRRLRSWGMNTIGNWSDTAIYRMRRTPYVATIGAGKQPLEGSTGYWGKFPDVFDPDFRKTLVKNLEKEKASSIDDLWCIGYFVDNELAWGDELSLAVATLISPPEQVAKKVFLADLRSKYNSIEELNASWATEHESWDALLQTSTPPDLARARVDLLAFYSKTAEQYFRTCHDAIQQVAPEKLYLGCRFAWVNDVAVVAAAKYCDVVSFNRYQSSVADFRLPEGVDKAAIIGEFHFGALDRGMFHTGLQAVEDQSARAAAYTTYVTGALQNPWLVGTHWFQYGDQATTGRGDGENYQIGFLDICDTPYPEIVEASRKLGSAMYELRSRSAVPAADDVRQKRPTGE